jgi:hypothetical protein
MVVDFPVYRWYDFEAVGLLRKNEAIERVQQCWLHRRYSGNTSLPGARVHNNNTAWFNVLCF